MNWIFTSVVTVSFVLFFAKIFGVKTIKWNETVFDLKNAWIVFAILTLIHFIFGRQLRKAIKLVLDSRCVKLTTDIYLDICSGENYFFRTLHRQPPLTNFISKTFMFVRNDRDTSYWIRVLVDLFLFVSLVIPPTTNLQIQLAILIVFANSFVASFYLASFYHLAFYGGDAKKIYSIMQ